MLHSDKRKAVRFRSCSLSASNWSIRTQQCNRHALRISPSVGRKLLLVFTAGFSYGVHYALCRASEAAAATLKPGSHQHISRTSDENSYVRETGAATKTPGAQREISHVEGDGFYHAPTTEPGAARHQWLGASRAPVTEPGTSGQARTVEGASLYYAADAEADDSLSVERRGSKSRSTSGLRARGSYTAGETSSEQPQGPWLASLAMEETFAQKARQQEEGTNKNAMEETEAKEANMARVDQEAYEQNKRKELQKPKSDQEEEEGTKDSEERRMEETEGGLENRLVEVEEEREEKATSEQHSKAEGEAAKRLHAEEKEEQLDVGTERKHVGKQEDIHKYEGEKLQVDVTAEALEMEEQDEMQEVEAWEQEEEEPLKAEGEEKEKQEEEEGDIKLQVREVAAALGNEKPTRGEKHEGDGKKGKAVSGVEGKKGERHSGEVLESDVNVMQEEGKEEQDIKAKEGEKVEKADIRAPQKNQENQGGKQKGVKDSGKDSTAERQAIQVLMLQKEGQNKEEMNWGTEEEKGEEQGTEEGVHRERKLGVEVETENHEGIQEKVAAQRQKGDEQHGKASVKKGDLVKGEEEEERQAQKQEGKGGEDVVAQGKKQGDQGQEKRSMEEEHDVKKGKEEQEQASKQGEEKKEEGVTVPTTAKDKQGIKQQEKGEEMEESRVETGGLGKKIAVKDARGVKEEVKGKQLDKGTQGNKQKEEGGAAKGNGADVTTEGKETSGSAEKQEYREPIKVLGDALVNGISLIEKQHDSLEKTFFPEYFKPPESGHPLCVFPDSLWCKKRTMQGIRFPYDVSDLFQRINAFFASMFKLPRIHVALPSPHLSTGGRAGSELSVQLRSTCHLAFALDPQALTEELRLYMTPSEHRVGLVADRRVQRSEQNKALYRMFRSETRLHAVASVADECMLSEKLAEAGLIGWSHDGVADGRVRILVTFPSKAHAKDLLEHKQVSEEAYKRFVDEKDLKQLLPDEKCLLSGRTQSECDRLKAQVSEEREFVTTFATQGYAENEVRIPPFVYA